MISGWIISFFPFLKNGKENMFCWNKKNWKLTTELDDFEIPKYIGLSTDDFDYRLNKVPFIWRYYGMKYNMLFVGGFVGVSVNEEDSSISPVFGYGVIDDVKDNMIESIELQASENETANDSFKFQNSYKITINDINKNTDNSSEEDDESKHNEEIKLKNSRLNSFELDEYELRSFQKVSRESSDFSNNDDIGIREKFESYINSLQNSVNVELQNGKVAIADEESKNEESSDSSDLNEIINRRQRILEIIEAQKDEDNKSQCGDNKSNEKELENDEQPFIFQFKETGYNKKRDLLTANISFEIVEKKIIMQNQNEVSSNESVVSNDNLDTSVDVRRDVVDPSDSEEKEINELLEQLVLEKQTSMVELHNVELDDNVNEMNVEESFYSKNNEGEFFSANISFDFNENDTRNKSQVYSLAVPKELNKINNQKINQDETCLNELITTKEIEEDKPKKKQAPVLNTNVVRFQESEIELNNINESTNTVSEEKKEKKKRTFFSKMVKRCEIL